ncbi:MAG TPA: ABC transporter permease [Polyangiaceae bacterium]|nr:ABC transporter permease [Polyangiaceae bacterium]
MTLSSIVYRNALRQGLRGALTVVAVGVLLVVFVLLRTVVAAWNAGSDYAAKDRLTTRSRVSYGLTLPKRYLERIATVPGVTAVTFCDWFGARWAKAPTEFFANMACAENAFDVYPEIQVSKETLARWKTERQGAIVGDMLAKKLGFHVGDRVTLEGSFYPGDWDFTIVGLYTAPPQSAADRSSFFFRWDYKNDGVPEAKKNRIGWIFTRVDDPSRAAAVSRAIDDLFSNDDTPTLTQSERAANNALLGSVIAVLKALDVICALVLLIGGLVLGNTVAMGVRERTTEYGVLAALGFPPRLLARFILGEAFLVGLVAGVFGLLIAYPIVELGIGRYLEENVGQFFPVFRITPGTAGLAVGLSVLLGVVAALVPALRVARLSVVDALRRVG